MKLRYFGVILCSALMAGCADTSEIIPDFCPDNPNKDAPGICGCDKPDADENQNGIMDCLETGTDIFPGIDHCPGNENKTIPGVCGCDTDDTDTDGDTTPDCIDKCENNKNKLYPGYCGCDSDADDVDENANTIPDCLENVEDACPEDPDKTIPGICGCGTQDVDTDGDGTMDCVDMCQEDPNKTEPGTCDCGNPDVDSDGDTALDCQDECAQDDQKTEKGICGCGAEDSEENVADSDGDTVPDCLDGCRDNPNKTEPGEAGCDAVEDNDSDGDGVDNESDPCPFNPNITEGKDVDCNYVTEGSDLIFEIWHASDLERLRTEIEAILPDGRVGLVCSAGESKCSDNNTMITCSAAGVFSASEVSIFTPGKCASNAICQLNSSQKAECVTLACNAVDAPSKPNDCCTADFNSICHSDKEVYKCQGDRIVASTCTKCTTSNGLASCKTCTETDNPSKFNDCCDSSFKPKCSTANEQVSCINDSIAVTQCPGGCAVDSETKEVTCRGCNTPDGNPTKIGDCCDAKKDLIEVCHSDKTALKCINGSVQEISCVGACDTNGSTLFCQQETPVAQQFHARLMNDIDLSDADIQKKTVHSRCYAEWTPLELYQTHFDGNDKQITLDDCMLVKPLFNTILESKVTNLKLNYNLGGNISSALAHFVSASYIDNVSFNGVVNRAATVFDEVTPGFGTFAAFAANSTFSNISYAGVFDSPIGNTYGFVNKAVNCSFFKLEAKPELFRCYSNPCSPGFNLLNNTNLIADAKVDIPRLEQLSGSLYGFINATNALTYIHDVSVKLGDVSFGSSPFYAFSNTLHSSDKISLELENVKGTNIFYINSTLYNKNTNWTVKLKSLASANVLLMAGSAAGNAVLKNWKADIDEIDSTGPVYTLLATMNTGASIENAQYHIKKLSTTAQIYLIDTLYDKTSISKSGIRLDYAKGSTFPGIKLYSESVTTNISDFSVYVDGYMTSENNNANLIKSDTSSTIELKNVVLSGRYHFCKSAKDCSSTSSNAYALDIPMVMASIGSKTVLNPHNVYWHKYTKSAAALPAKFNDVETMTDALNSQLAALNEKLIAFTPAETSTIVSTLAKDSPDWTSLEITVDSDKIQIPWYGK